MQGKLRSIFVGAEDVLCQNCVVNTLCMQIKDIRPPLNLFETGAAGIKSLKQVFFKHPVVTKPLLSHCKGRHGTKPVVR